jgi:SM-20-related protein
MAWRADSDVIAALHRAGYAVHDAFLDDREVAYWRAFALARRADGTLRPAAIGRGAQRAVHAELRADHIAWIDPDPSQPRQAELAARLEALRLAFNEALQLGLFDLELQVAIYPAGAFYRRHVDRFRDDDARVVSLVCYLNQDWTESDGGRLRLWPASAPQTFVDIAPRAGRLVAFWSADTAHEVLPTQRERFSLTGWLRRRR